MKRIQKIHGIIALLFFAGVTVVKPAAFEATTAFDPVAVLEQAFTFGLLVFFCFRLWRPLSRHLSLLWGPMPLALMTIASTLWSIDPSLTFRRSLVFFSANVFAYYLGVMYEPRALIGLFRRAFFIMICTSLAVMILLPSYGKSPIGWTGSFFHKNRLGEMMGLAVITFAIAPTGPLPRSVRWLITAAALGLLYGSQSGTPITGLAIVIAAQGLWWLCQLKRKVLSGILLFSSPFVVVVIALIATYSTALFALIGRDTTFTGRTSLWTGVIRSIEQRPLLGYGYLTFWHQIGGTPLLVRELTPFQAPHAHSGFLDVMIHVGLIGFTLFLLFYVWNMWLAIRESRRTGSPEARWFFSFLIFMVATNFTESQILEPFFFLWTTMTALSISFAIQRANRFQEIELEDDFTAADQNELISASA